MQNTVIQELSDSELERAVQRLANCERRMTVDLIEHLAELAARRLYLAAGFRSLYLYCRDVLRLSESESYNRMEAAKAVRRYPVLLEGLREAALNLTTVRLIAPHLTEANHQALIGECCGKSKRQVEDIVARLAPKVDVPASIRKLPAAGQRALDSAAASPALPAPAVSSMVSDPPQGRVPQPALSTQPTPPPRPLVTALSPDRYQVRFTASAATCEKLRLAQDLLRHAVPDGDPAQIIDCALTLLLADIVRKKAAVTANPRPRTKAADAAGGPVVRRRTRHIPARVRRAVWLRDGGRCAFRSKAGHRCEAGALLEYHHLDPEGVGGEPSERNIELRCRAHNQYEALLFYGPEVVRRATTRPLAPERVPTALRATGRNQTGRLCHPGGGVPQ